MNPSQFVQKWRGSELTERSASQQHFLDLCELFDHPKPAEVDKTGESFTFEKGAQKHKGGKGWADVWKKDYFGWEYKGKHKDLDAAYDQLLEYREDLENPPILVVCDMDRFVVRTNFTATPCATHEITLDHFSKPDNLEILRNVFWEPDKLRPGRGSEIITEQVAGPIGDLAQGLRERGLPPLDVARFLDRIVFCLFAEDVGLLPKDLFRNIVEKSRDKPDRFKAHLKDLFDKMANGGYFGDDVIRHFNGNLFLQGVVLELTGDEIEDVYNASRREWNRVDPSIFGTLFERGMDPDKRSQIGAHYTSRADIETLIEPVVMWPLRGEWQETRETVDNLLTTGSKKSRAKKAGPPKGAKLQKARKEAGILIERFRHKLRTVTVLDPACGSGNFLYVTLQKLLELEKEVAQYEEEAGFEALPPRVGPWQLFGIEINEYAYDLAQMVVWIGYLQWMLQYGYRVEREPILAGMKGNFECKDAILDLSDADNPQEPTWPKVDFIVGNPPFLGTSFLRAELGDDYVAALYSTWESRIPKTTDLCCYWFEKARAQVEAGSCQRAGLLATQGIRGGANRDVLKRIKETGDIFFAESDRPWVLDGANVHVSMAAFDDASESLKVLDGRTVSAINPNLSGGADAVSAQPLARNQSLCFRASEKGGDFDIAESTAIGLLMSPNPHGRPNSDVVRPWLNGKMVLRREDHGWIIDYGVNCSEQDAALCEGPYECLSRNVRPQRGRSSDKRLREQWWLHRRNAIDMREAVRLLGRFLATAALAKHRVFVWLDGPVLPDHQLYVFARSDDYFFGVLHSRIHEVWARAQGTQLRERESGFRYTPTTCFETFPFPWPPGKEPTLTPTLSQEEREAPTLSEGERGAVSEGEREKGWQGDTQSPLPPGGGKGEGTRKPPLPPEIVRRARTMRKHPTDAEARLWYFLRNRQLGGVKFRRQHPVGRYILDFYCHERRLGIELDGGQHAEARRAKYDVRREDELAEEGINVIRIWNIDALQNTEGVLQHIWDSLHALTPALSQGERDIPLPPGGGTGEGRRVQTIGGAAKELDELRNNWLNPPEWTETEVLEFPGSMDGPWARYVHDADKRGIGTVRYPRIVPVGELEATKLKRRTLTNLYNERPTWLDNAHRKLDEAVFAAYADTTKDDAWSPDMSDEEILEKLLALNLARAAG